MIEIIDGKEYNVWNSRHRRMMFYLLNPAMSLVELFGIGSPKKVHIEIDPNKPIQERLFVICPHCHHIHPGSTWSQPNKTAFKNWFGLYCHRCSGIIPCLRNYTSQLILWITYPLWFWWVGRWKKSWLEKQPDRYAHISTENINYKKANWWKAGALWGLMMYVVMTPLAPLIMNQPFRLENALINIPIYAFGGLLFGLGMKFLMHRQATKRID